MVPETRQTSIHGSLLIGEIVMPGSHISVELCANCPTIARGFYGSSIVRGQLHNSLLLRALCALFSAGVKAGA